MLSESPCSDKTSIAWGNLSQTKEVSQFTKLWRSSDVILAVIFFLATVTSQV
jgi:hypothetical protein